VPQKAHRPHRGRLDELIKLDGAIRLFDRDHGIAKFNQIILLQIQNLLADLLGLGFGRKRDNDEIAHDVVLSCLIRGGSYCAHRASILIGCLSNVKRNRELARP
jgi:hypothetical protein